VNQADTSKNAMTAAFPVGFGRGVKAGGASEQAGGISAC
jgi:hypothetical protein